MNDLPADLTFEQQEGAVMTDNKEREKVIADILSYLTDCDSTPKQDVCVSKQIAAYVVKEVDQAEARGMKKAAEKISSILEEPHNGPEYEYDDYASGTDIANDIVRTKSNEIITEANKTLEAEGVIKP